MQGEYNMESDILKEFLNYIDFLRELGYFVSLSGLVIDLNHIRASF